MKLKVYQVDYLVTFRRKGRKGREITVERGFVLPAPSKEHAIENFKALFDEHLAHIHILGAGKVTE